LRGLGPGSIEGQVAPPRNQEGRRDSAASGPSKDTANADHVCSSVQETVGETLGEEARGDSTKGAAKNGDTGYMILTVQRKNRNEEINGDF